MQEGQPEARQVTSSCGPCGPPRPTLPLFQALGPVAHWRTSGLAEQLGGGHLGITTRPEELEQRDCQALAYCHLGVSPTGRLKWPSPQDPCPETSSGLHFLIQRDMRREEGETVPVQECRCS